MAEYYRFEGTNWLRRHHEAGSEPVQRGDVVKDPLPAEKEKFGDLLTKIENPAQHPEIDVEEVDESSGGDGASDDDGDEFSPEAVDLEEADAESLSDYTVDELKSLADFNGVDYKSDVRKAELIDLILEAA